MREYEVVITNAAEKDLQDIFTYIATELSEPETAIKLCNKIEKEILNLDTIPHRHALYKKAPWFSRGLRFFPVDNFLIFYIVNDTDSKVHVLRVLYGECNVEDQL